ncbi:MAG: PA14 domain-containing protein [Verrucomicrobia bacterium]|nr:PA14 domain-containing protein [Verrucomicrobiota bacterium]
MKRKLFIPIKLFAIAMAILTPIATTYAQKDVTQPGDPIIASSANSPGSEGVANAIDGQPTKYLNRDSGVAGGTSGFVVSPSIGATVVTGIAMQSANDSPNRDPKIVTLEGSNDTAITDYASGTWELIVRLDDIPAYGARFETQTFNFPNFKAYKHYRWTIVETAGAANGCCMQIAEVELLGSVLPGDVTQPGDPIIASSANSPGSEGVANAIDGQPTKYLNRDSGVAGGTSGFVVSPSIGATVVTGIAMQSANDSPNRDPKIVTLEGSNDDAIADYASGTWTLIQRIDDIPAYAARFQTQTFLFDNFKPYKHYRWTIVETAGAANGCCMQIAEVELLGGGAPKDITQPGDPIIASSANSPGSEGPANAIDGQPTKYLNRDSGVAGGTSGFVVTPSIGETTITGIAMQSANDSPNRDPKIITIEGSNDTEASYTSGTWELITRIDNIPEYTDRFQTQTFYFQNTKSYKHYRWTIVETAGAANGCCMQIAEVELLAVTQGADCNKARFLTQPVNTPVLDGAEATFFTVVNGPWPVQWMKNGKAIPGATSLSYTTSAVTAANAADVYKVEIVGCEASTEVKAEIFKPSAIKSIGFSFSGGGANGAPTDMNDTDIAGVHPQAHWNNLAGGSGISDIIVDSDNAETFAFLEWQTSGQWGAGTGSASSTQRMLNGLVYANPGAPSTLTFGNVPAGNHSVILYTVGIPLQFQNVNYSVNGSKVFTRNVNADEYNASPGFFRGTSTSAAAPSLATYVRFDNVSGAGGSITIEFETTTTGFDRGGPINAIQLLLNAPATGTPPTIATHPQPAVGAKDGAVRLSVSTQGADLTYQWRKNGRNLPDGGNITGATSADLTISSLSEADVASYSVAVFNPAGSVISKTVAVRVATFKIDEALVGYWKFDETGGSSAANAAPGAPAGAITGSAAWGAGKIGNALRLDGSTTYVFVPNYTKAKRQMAASGWVNVGASVFEGVAFLRNAIGNLGTGLGSTGNSLEGQFEFGLVEDLDAGGMRLTAGIGAGPNVVRATQSGLFTLGSWQHVAFSADGAQLRLYINGAEVASTDYITDINPPNATLPWLSIGARLNKEDVLDAASPLLPDLTLPYFMAGQIDDLALWTRGLSADEVSLIHAAGNAGNAVTTVTPEAPVEPPPAGGGGLNTNGLVAYWNFDGHLSDAIKDFHGTARGATPVAFGDGKAGFGKAITLNGANFVEITGGNNKELQFPGGSMSIAGWFKVGTFDKNWQALISKGEQLNYRVARRSGEASLAYAGGVGEGTNNAPDVNDGNWHHFTAVSDATVAEFGTALYIDGTRYEVNATKPVLADGTLNLMIGENPGALNRQWNGSIDDISIWNRVLTAGEVTALYAGGTGVAISTLPGVKAPTPPPPPFDGITADKSAGPSLAIPGTGLKGEYWQRGVNTIATDGNTVDANRVDTQIAGFGAASGTFTATVLNYLGNDLSEMPAWLGDDAGSYSGTPGNLDDGAFRFTGFLNIAAPGIINIGTTSDDGTRIKIAGKDVINNDGGHGDATVDADVAFEAAGVYPIEVTYFNGDWTSDGNSHSGNPDPSVHGGANFHLRINGNNVGTGELDLFFTTADGLPPAPARPAIALGLNFGASEPDGANTFVVAATESAGAPGVAQANWNNLSGPTGTGANLVADARGAAVPTGISVEWVSNGSWASTGRSENNGTNFKPGTADFNLMGGYLDTGAATTTTVTISGVDAGIAAAGYDVYVYANGGVADGRAGAYRIVNAATGEAITEYVLATSATAPTDYVQVPTGLAAGVYGAGTHIVFGGIKATSIRVEATTADGLGAGSPPRAPINAIQLTSPSMASGGGGGGMISIARSATGITLTFDGTLQSADAVGGPYTDVAGATSPAAISFSGSGKFYRSRQ